MPNLTLLVAKFDKGYIRVTLAVYLNALPIIYLDSTSQIMHSVKLSIILSKFIGHINSPFHYLFLLSQQLTTYILVRCFPLT
jgi:hypothetical protein